MPYIKKTVQLKAKEILTESVLTLASAPSPVFELESIQDCLQLLTRDLILPTNTVSATVDGEEGTVMGSGKIGFPDRNLDADSCSLDKYEIPVHQKNIIKRQTPKETNREMK